MAIKATAQTTIIDVTDAYSVMLTSEAYTFVGGTGGVDQDRLVQQKLSHTVVQISVLLYQ